MAYEVLIVAGYAGNELYYPNLLTGRKLGTVWVNPPGLLLGGWDRMKLNPSGTGPGPGIWVHLRPGGPLADYYNKLCDYLRSRGWNPVGAVFDWRHRLAASGDEVARQIEGLYKGDPIQIVAHSRGGLAVASALHKLAAKDKLHYVRNVVTLGTPYAGSYLPVPWFGGWTEQNKLFTAYAASGLDRAPVPLPSVSPRDMFASFPSSYELLIDPAYAATQGDHQAAGLYDPENWDRAGVPLNPARLAEAQGLWDARRILPAGVRSLILVGQGTPTQGPTGDVSSLNTSAALGDGIDGDGVVPLWSATRPGGNIIRLPVDHRALCTDGAALSLIHGHISA